MASQNILEVTDGNFEKEILKAAQPALVDFWAPWCAPCRNIAPHIEALAATYAGQVRVGKCDIDQNHGLPSQFDVRSIPTLLMFKGGQVVGQIVGAAPKTKIEEMVKKALGIG
jgi:thioredoxin 1